MARYTAPSESSIVAATKDAAVKIAELQMEAESKGSLRTDTYEHMISLFKGSHTLGVDDNKRYVNFDAKSAKPADIILRVQGMLTVDPKFQYVAPASGPKDDAKNDNIERFVNTFYPHLFRKYGERWDFKSTFWQLLVGVGYLQQSYEPYAWDKDELKRRSGEEDKDYNERSDNYRMHAGPPVFVENIDPRMIWPIRTPRGTRAWVKMYRVERYQFEAEFARRGRRIKRNDKDEIIGTERMRGMAGQEYPVTAETTDSSAVDYYEYIDDQHCFYVVDSQVIDQYRHRGGIKIFPSYGLQTGLREAHLEHLGILWAVRNELPQYDFFRTLWANKAYLDVFPQLLAELSEGDDLITGDDNHPMVWDIEPGTIKQMRGQLRNVIKDAQSGIDFRALIETQAADIDLATISGLARGMAGAQQPGYAINQLTQAMRTLWKPIILSRTLQFSQMAEHFLWILKTLVKRKTGLYVQTEDDNGRMRGEYISLDPDDVQEYFRIEAQMEPDLPIDRQGLIQLYSAEVERGNATFEELTRDAYGYTNPVARKLQIARDQFERLAQPKVYEDAIALGRAKLGNEILQALGLDKLNTTFGMDLQKLKAARSGQVPGTDMAGAQPPGAAVAVGADGMPMVPGGNGAAMPPEAGAVNGIPPTVGANPANPAPGPRR